MRIAQGRGEDSGARGSGSISNSRSGRVAGETLALGAGIGAAGGVLEAGRWTIGVRGRRGNGGQSDFP